MGVYGQEKTQNSLMVIFFQTFDQPHGVDGLGDEFELVTLAMSFLQDF